MRREFNPSLAVLNHGLNAPNSVCGTAALPGVSGTDGHLSATGWWPWMVTVPESTVLNTKSRLKLCFGCRERDPPDGQVDTESLMSLSGRAGWTHGPERNLQLLMGQDFNKQTNWSNSCRFTNTSPALTPITCCRFTALH